MLKGIASIGTGKLIGRVNIVNDPRNDYFETGKILVCPKTTIDSIQMIKRASAVITNYGTRLSHAYIVCRDNKIPCIVGTGTATQLLTEDIKVELDFDTKEIKIIKE